MHPHRSLKHKHLCTRSFLHLESHSCMKKKVFGKLYLCFRTVIPLCECSCSQRSPEMTAGLLCMPSSGLYSLHPTLTNTQQMFLSFVHCSLLLLTASPSHIAKQIYLHWTELFLLPCTHPLQSFPCLALCLFILLSFSNTHSSVIVAVCVIFLSVFLSSHVLCAWQPARACYCDSFSSPSWLRLVPWCHQPRVGLVLGVLKQPSFSTRCHQPLTSPRAPSPQGPKGVSISPGYSPSSAVGLVNNFKMQFNFQLCIALKPWQTLILIKKTTKNKTLK